MGPAHARFGRLPFSDLLRPAIELARDGFPLADSPARYAAECRDLLAATPATAAAYLRPDGAPPRRGEVVRLPRLADTLEAVATGGRDAFYTGVVGAAIVAALARDGGVLTADDLAAHRSDWVEPARTAYRGRSVVAPPPNSQGFAGLQILGMLEHVDVAALAEDPVGYVDAVVRATALAFEDRDRYLCDPASGDIPLERLLDPAYLAERAALLGGAGGPAAALVAPRPRATRRSAARSTPTATPPRSSRASTRSGARGSWPATPACSCRTAAASSRSTPRTPTASRPPSAPRTRSRRRC